MTVLRARRGHSVPLQDQDEGNDADINMADRLQRISENVEMLDATVVTKAISQKGPQKMDTTDVDGVLEDVTMLSAPLAAASQTQAVLPSTNSAGVHEYTTEDIKLADAPAPGMDVCENTVTATARYHVEGSNAEASNSGDRQAIPTNTVTISDRNDSIEIPGKPLNPLELKKKSLAEIHFNSPTGTLGLDDCFAITKAEPTFARSVKAHAESAVSRKDVGNNVSDNRTLTFTDSTTGSQSGVNTKSAKISANTLETIDIIESSFPGAPPPTSRVARSAVAAPAASTCQPEQKSLIVKLRFTARLESLQAALPGGAAEPNEVDVVKQDTETELTLRHTDNEAAGVPALPIATRENISSLVSNTATCTVTITSQAGTALSAAASKFKAAVKPRPSRSKKVKCTTKSGVAVPETSHKARGGTDFSLNGSVPRVESVKIATSDTNPPGCQPVNKRVPKPRVEIAAAKSAAETENGVELPGLGGELVHLPVVENRETQSARTAAPRKRVRRTKAQIAADNAAAEAAKSRPIAHKATGLRESSRSATEGITSPPATCNEAAAIPGSIEELTQNVSIANPTRRPSRARKPSIKAREGQDSMKPVPQKTSKFQKTPGLSNALGSSASVVAEAPDIEISTIPAAIDTLPTRKRKRETKVDAAAKKPAALGNIEDSSLKAFEGGTMPVLTQPTTKLSMRRARGTSSKPLPRRAEAGPMTEAHMAYVTMLDVAGQSASFKEPGLRKGNALGKKALANKQAPKPIRTGSTRATPPLGAAQCPAAIEQDFLASAPLHRTKPVSRVADAGAYISGFCTSAKTPGQQASLQQPINSSPDLREPSAADGNQLLFQTYNIGGQPSMSAVKPSVPTSTPGQGHVQTRKASKRPPVMVGCGTIITFKGYPKPSLPLPTIQESPATKAMATRIVEDTANADTDALRKTSPQHHGRLLPSIDDPGSSCIGPDPKPIQDAEEVCSITPYIMNPGLTTF